MKATEALTAPEQNKRLELPIWERYMTPERWQEALGILEQFRFHNEKESGDVPSFLHYAVLLALTFPDRINELSLDTRTKDWLISYQQDDQNAGNPSCECNHRILILFPEARGELEYDHLWQPLYDEFKSSDNIGKVIKIAMVLRILFPERSDEIALDDDKWKSISSRLEEGHPSNIEMQMEDAALTRLISAEQFQTIDIDWMTPEVFEREVEAAFEKSGDFAEHLELLCNIRILEADEAYIDDNGMIRIKDVRSPLSKTPPLPERPSV